MIQNPNKFNKMAAFFAAIATALLALFAMGDSFFYLISTFENIRYYAKDFMSLFIRLFYSSGDILNVLSLVAVVLILLRGKKDLIAAIGLVLSAAVAILYYVPAYCFDALDYIRSEGFSFGLFLEVVLYLLSVLGLIVFRGVLAYSCFTKGKFPGEKLSWLPIAAVGLFVITTFLYMSDAAYFFEYVEDGLLNALRNCFYIGFNTYSVLEMISVVFLGFAFYIPCTEKAEVVAEN